MQLNYHLSFPNPQNHYAKIRIDFVRSDQDDQMSFFLPSWSPGSYLMREYSRNIRSLEVFDESGDRVFVQQSHKNQWLVDFKDHKSSKKFSLSYEVYCHELTVRTSHIDSSHAFIHGPSVFMGVLNSEMKNPTLKVDVPAQWSKISTGLKEVSQKRDEFIFTAADYDELIDAPLEIGCHETDGFYVDGKAHELAFYGLTLPAGKEFCMDLKDDIKKIVEHVSKTMGGMPYDEKYTFITHFVPGKFGGLEHLNSTALHFCPLKLNDRKMYLKWLELVAHEYFHTWNVKRIRPVELGPFDYVSEAMTRMHWLTEGLTSFMDQLFVYRAGFSKLEEYCDMMKDNFNNYWKIPGRRFDSLEDSSFNAWIKLYRPDENSHNSSISYYLKGGIVFFALHVLFVKEGKKIDDLLSLLWQRYLDNPSRGVDAEEVYGMIEKVAGKDVREKFETMVQTTEEIDLQALCESIGMKFVYDDEAASKPYLGVKTSSRGQRVFIDSVSLDGPGYRSGLNAGDEIIAINGMRIDSGKWSDHVKYLLPGQRYHFLVSRLEYLCELDVEVGPAPKLLKAIEVADEVKLSKSLN